MALELVDILVETDDVVPVPVDGVVVRVYDAAGTTLITSGTTGAPADPGHVEFTLNGEVAPDTYQLRFFYSGGAIESPMLIEVYSPPAGSPTGTNSFAVPIHLFTLPEAVDPLLCRASGYFRDVTGQALPGVDVHFVSQYSPLIAGGDGIMGERVHARSNAQGYFSIDLYRGGCFQVIIEGHENEPREILVPDRAAVSIIDILFPVVMSVVYDPAPAYALTVGDTLDLTPVVTATNYQILTGAASGDVEYEIDDPTIASVAVSAGTLVLTALAAGTTTLTATRRDSSLVRLPDNGINGSPASITVT